MVKDFEPSLYKGRISGKTGERLLNRKLQERILQLLHPGVQVNAIDIMEALKQSLVQAGVKMTDIWKTKSIKPMLIGTEGEPFDSDEYIYELKLDGERCIAYLDSDKTILKIRGIY